MLSSQTEEPSCSLQFLSCTPFPCVHPQSRPATVLAADYHLTFTSPSLCSGVLPSSPRITLLTYTLTCTPFHSLGSLVEQSPSPLSLINWLHYTSPFSQGNFQVNCAQRQGFCLSPLHKNIFLKTELSTFINRDTLLEKSGFLASPVNENLLPPLNEHTQMAKS